MFYSILFKLPIFNNNENKSILIFIIGSIIYAFMHYILFSQILEKYARIQKYKYLMYAIFIIDLIYAKTQYDAHMETFINKYNKNKQDNENKSEKHDKKHNDNYDNNEITGKKQQVNTYIEHNNTETDGNANIIQPVTTKVPNINNTERDQHRNVIPRKTTLTEEIMQKIKSEPFNHIPLFKSSAVNNKQEDIISNDINTDNNDSNDVNDVNSKSESESESESDMDNNYVSDNKAIIDNLSSVSHNSHVSHISHISNISDNNSKPQPTIIE